MYSIDIYYINEIITYLYVSRGAFGWHGITVSS